MLAMFFEKIVDINFILIAKLIKEVNDGIKNILNY
jgi:hypothetical protein